MSYTVRAQRWEHLWELHIYRDGEEVGVTQATSLRKAEYMVRDYLSIMVGGDPTSFDVGIDVDLGDAALTAEVQEAREGARRLAALQCTVGERSRAAARRLREAGLSGVEIATVLEVSPQRASQLLRGE